jgi:RNA polymerase sigma factor (sigma-70 family)
MIDVTDVFQTHHAGLHRYLLAMTGDPDLAADAAQEAFVRLHERPPATATHLRAWLYRVATNFALDTVRVTTRRAAIAAERPDIGTPTQNAIPDVQLEHTERRAVVQRALTALRPTERAVLVMRAQGFAYREIADALEIPMNSIGAIGARGLRKLSAQLAPMEAQLR